jgi:hypothetical protein
MILLVLFVYLFVLSQMTTGSALKCALTRALATYVGPVNFAPWLLEEHRRNGVLLHNWTSNTIVVHETPRKIKEIPSPTVVSLAAHQSAQQRA